MVRWLAIFLLLLLGGPAAAGDPAVSDGDDAAGIDALDAQDGFRDARFGAQLKSFEGLELVSERGAAGTSVYVRPSDELQLGQARLDGVSYGFWQGELYFVALFTSGRHNAEAALRQLEDAYGPGTTVSGAARERVWHGERVLLHFREDPVTSMGMVGLTSIPIDRRVKADREPLPAKLAP